MTEWKTTHNLMFKDRLPDGRYLIVPFVEQAEAEAELAAAEAACDEGSLQRTEAMLMRISTLEEGWQKLKQHIKDEVHYITNHHPVGLEVKLKVLEEVLQEMDNIKPSGDGKGKEPRKVTPIAGSQEAPPETPDGQKYGCPKSIKKDNEWFCDLDGTRCHTACSWFFGWKTGVGLKSAFPKTPESAELIAWCEEHGRETVNKVIFGSFDSYSSGFTLFFKCGRKNWFKFPFLLDPVFTIPSDGEPAGYGAQGEPATPLSPDVVLGLETPASISPEGEFTCDECDKHMDTIAVQLDFGFGSTHDEERFEFCSDECFAKWVHKTFPLPTMPEAPIDVHCPNCQTECRPMSTPDWDNINKVWVTEYRCKNCRQIFGMHTKPPVHL